MDPEKVPELRRLLTVTVPLVREEGAPDWWLGDEEAWESSERAHLQAVSHG